jgi:hypothetical protein
MKTKAQRALDCLFPVSGFYQILSPSKLGKAGILMVVRGAKVLTTEGDWIALEEHFTDEKGNVWRDIVVGKMNG